MVTIIHVTCRIYTVHVKQPEAQKRFKITFYFGAFIYTEMFFNVHRLCEFERCSNIGRNLSKAISIKVLKLDPHEVCL